MIRRESTYTPQASPSQGSHDSRPVPFGNSRLTMEPPPQFPAAIINVTNRCNLRCFHCYLYADGNPNHPND